MIMGQKTYKGLLFQGKPYCLLNGVYLQGDMVYWEWFVYPGPWPAHFVGVFKQANPIQTYIHKTLVQDIIIYMETTLENKCIILADLWMNYRMDEEFRDFVEYNDIGLPISYALANSIVLPTKMSNDFINETFNLFLAGLGIEDEGFENLEDILSL